MMWRARFARAGREGSRPGKPLAGQVPSSERLGKDCPNAQGSMRADPEAGADPADGRALTERGHYLRVLLGVGLGPLRSVGGGGTVACGEVRPDLGATASSRAFVSARIGLSSAQETEGL